MKLYFTQGACSLAVRIVINELGLKCDYESVDLKTKRTESGKNFLEINPKGSVPALELDNGYVLTENAVIQQYLADTHKATTLLPALGNFKRYEVLEWLNYVATEMHKGVGILFNHVLPQEIKEKYFHPMIDAKLNYLNKHFEKSKFIAGSEFTLPDAYMVVIINWLYLFKFDLKKWPNVLAYYDRLKNQNAVKQSLQQENLQVPA